MQSLLDYLTQRSIPFEKDVPLSHKTWIKTGGICNCWIIPQDKAQLIDVCQFLFNKNYEFDVVGQTSNLFIHSTCNPKVLVSTIQVKAYTLGEGYIDCECGVSVVKLAKDCLAQGYKGFYGLVGLPGTVAAAIHNNAGCFGCSLSSMLRYVECLLPMGEIVKMGKEQLGLSHRSSVFKRKTFQGIILSVHLVIEKAPSAEEEIKKSQETVLYRKQKQEGPYKNLGSVYSRKMYRRNLRNIIASSLSWFLSKTKHYESRVKIQKSLLLSLYGFTELKDYISDKSINTFIWKDEHSEDKFLLYKIFMSQVFSHLEIEIEERF